MSNPEAPVLPINQHPITQLPSELLAIIFLACKANDYYPLSYHSRTWIAVTYVCRLWRGVAITCPDLWVDINSKYPRWVEEMILRSKGAFLRIYLNLTQPTSNQLYAIQLVLREVYRAKELMLEASNATLDSFFSAYPAVSPWLESLILHSCGAWRSFDFSFPKTDADLDHGKPHLQHLDLTAYCVKWDSPILLGLTSLSLTYIPSDCRPRLSLFLDVLKNMPALQILNLFHSLPPYDEEPGTSLYSADDLPQLKDLNLRSNLAECAQLVDHLAFTPNCSIRITCDSFPVTELNYSTRLRQLLIPIANPKISTEEDREDVLFQRMNLYIDEMNFHLSVGEAALSTFQPPFRVVLTVRSLQNCTESMQILANTVPLVHLSTISINTAQFFRSGDVGLDGWKALFPKLSNLRNLQVNGLSGISFIKAILAIDFLIQPEIGDSDQGRPLARVEQVDSFGAVHIPLLESITLCYVNFSPDFDNGSHFLSKSTLLELLMLRRQKHGGGLQKLCLSRCNGIALADIRLFEKYVPDVQWDGLEHFEDSME